MSVGVLLQDKTNGNWERVEGACVVKQRNNNRVDITRHGDYKNSSEREGKGRGRYKQTKKVREKLRERENLNSKTLILKDRERKSVVYRQRTKETERLTEKKTKS